MKTQLFDADHSAAPPQIYTTAQVGATLHSHPESVRKACREGRIKGVHLGGRWRVSHAELCRIVEAGIPTHLLTGRREPTSAVPQRCPGGETMESISPPTTGGDQ